MYFIYTSNCCNNDYIEKFENLNKDVKKLKNFFENDFFKLLLKNKNDVKVIINSLFLNLSPQNTDLFWEFFEKNIKNFGNFLFYASKDCTFINNLFVAFNENNQTIRMV